MANKVGRPRLAIKDSLATVFAVRLRPDEAQDVAAAVRASGQKKSDWLRNALLAAASRKRPKP